MLALVLAVVTLSNIIQLGQGFTTDYCNQTLCLRWKGTKYVPEHNIGCNNNYGYTPKCPDNAEIQVVDNKIKNLILNLHNKHRNVIAGGKLSGYNSANRMTTMKWNNELAYLAQLNCFRCFYGADACRNTDSFSHVGQNIDIYWTSKGFLPIDKIINRIFMTWFREYTETGMKVIDAYFNSGRVVGHFTQIVSEKSSEVGCALINWPEPFGNHTRYYSYFVCNYSFTNYDRQPVYTAGATASSCQTGTNPKFSNLCSIEEIIIPVPSESNSC